MFESYFIRCVNTSKPRNASVRRQGGWMSLAPLPLFLSLSLSHAKETKPLLRRRLRYALRITRRSKSSLSKIALTAWSVRQSTQNYRLGLGLGLGPGLRLGLGTLRCHFSVKKKIQFET